MPTDDAGPRAGDVVVRAASVADGPALAALRWAWRVDERGEGGSTREEFEAAFTGWMRDHDGTHRALLALAAGRPVGMAWLAVVTRVPGPGVWRRLAGNLQSVYVLPAWRGYGVGGRLVVAAIGVARELELDYVSVHPSARSFPLYRRLGFADTSGVLELDLRRA